MIEARFDQIEDNKRSIQQRSRVMLAATIITPNRSVDVRIRNLSRTGALIEGDIALEAGTGIELLRGHNAVRAEVAWARPGRCGVKFARPVVIEDWVGSVGRPAAAAVSPAPVAAAPDRAEPPPSWLAVEGGPQEAGDRLSARLAEEIAYIGRLVEAVGADISANPAIMHRHAVSLQNCRNAASLLDDIARVLRADDRVQAAQGIRSAELKARLLRF